MSCAVAVAGFMSPTATNTKKKALVRKSPSNFDVDTLISLDGIRHTGITKTSRQELVG